MHSETAVTVAASPISRIRGLDYVAIFARDLPAMRRFYAEVMGFPRGRELGDIWFEYRVGSSILALTSKGAIFDEAETPAGAASLQLAFRVAPGEVSECGEALRTAGVAILRPPTDQPWGHRTLFFRDPDGNIVEIYADI